MMLYEELNRRFNHISDAIERIERWHIARSEKLESQVELLQRSQHLDYIHPQYEGRTIQIPL